MGQRTAQPEPRPAWPAANPARTPHHTAASDRPEITRVDVDPSRRQRDAIGRQATPIAARIVPLPLLAAFLLIVALALPAAAAGASVTLQPNQGPVGGQVQATGGGFPANDTLQIWFDQQDTGVRTTTDAQGNFSVSFSVPKASPGLYPVYALDGRNTASAPFTVTDQPPPLGWDPCKDAGVAAVPSSGPVGSKFVFNATRWAPGGNVQITLPYGSKGMFPAESIQPPVNQQGGWHTPVAVAAPTPPGEYTFTASQATDRCPGGKIERTVTFTVTASPPKIVATDTYVEGVMVYLSVSFTDADENAAGFGFRGARGSGWGEESHPFSDPSYGRVSPGRIDYPFNHGCGTATAYESDVEFWIYDADGKASDPVTVHLACH